MCDYYIVELTTCWYCLLWQSGNMILPPRTVHDYHNTWQTNNRHKHVTQIVQYILPINAHTCQIMKKTISLNFVPLHPPHLQKDGGGVRWGNSQKPIKITSKLAPVSHWHQEFFNSSIFHIFNPQIRFKKMSKANIFNIFLVLCFSII